MEQGAILTAAEIERRALELLRTAGEKFKQDAETDRAKACEEFLSTIMSNLDLIAQAHMERAVDSITKMVVSVQTLIGAPKKRVEAFEAEPMALLKDWLNKTPGAALDA